MDRGSDDFGDDDFFDDPNLLAEVEAQAFSSTQATRKVPAQTTNYDIEADERASVQHANRAAPKARPVFGYTKTGRPIHEPGPVNTEPRVSKGAFGWGDLGKFDGVTNLTSGDLNGYPRRTVDDEYGHHPDMVVDSTGRYRYGTQDEEEVVDKRAQTLSESLVAEAKPPVRNDPVAQARRRAALLGAMDSESPVGVPAAAPQPAPRLAASRSFSRSTSAGPNLFARPAMAGPSRLEPIMSQASQGSQLPSSQGSAARKAVFALEEEKRRTDDLERQLAQVREELEKARTESKGKAPVKAVHIDINSEVDLQRRAESLQTELWQAKGEAETMRRATKTEQERHIAEAEKLRRQVADMEEKLRERERETARQLESMKTQAVFNNHAVWNSAIKTRHPQSSQRGHLASQRPIPAPIFTGSPSRREKKESETAVLPQPQTKAKTPGRGFRGLVNAFRDDALPVNAKRQRTLPPGFAGSPSNSQDGLANPGSSPRSSPRKADSQSAARYDVDMAENDVELGWQEDVPDAVPRERNDRGELLHHLFNHISTSPILVEGRSEPDLYRMLRSAPVIRDDLKNAYDDICSDLLRACGDLESTWDDLISGVGKSLLGLAEISTRALLGDAQLQSQEVVAMITSLRLFASTASIFTDMVSRLVAGERSIGHLAERIASSSFGPETSQRLKARLPPTGIQSGVAKSLQVADPGEPEGSRDYARIWADELGDALASFCEAVCCNGDGRHIWVNGTLASVITTLAGPHNGSWVARRAVDLFWAGAMFDCNFRALLGSNGTGVSVAPPVIDQMSKLLGTVQSEDEATRGTIMILLRAFWALSIADEDAVLLIAQRSPLVPVLVQLLYQESSKVWGVRAQNHLLSAALEVLIPALRLLHQLTYPLPYMKPTTITSSQKAPPRDFTSATDLSKDFGTTPQGINLAARLTEANVVREYKGVLHMFQVALGPMAYVNIDISMFAGVDFNTDSSASGGSKKGQVWPSRDEMRLVQLLSQDLIEATMEGPEVDAVYDLYADDDSEGNNAVDEDSVDPEAYDAAMLID